MKRGLNIHDVSEEKPQSMKREPKFVRKQTFWAVQDGMTDRPVHDMKSQQKSKQHSISMTGKHDRVIRSPSKLHDSRLSTTK
jgi:hypothetical protein